MAVFLFRWCLDAHLCQRYVSAACYWEEGLTAHTQGKHCTSRITEQPMSLADKNSNISNL